MPVGAYDMTVAKFGYGPAAASGVIFRERRRNHGQRTSPSRPTADAPRQRNEVKDGSGHGWPLYARLEVSGPIRLSRSKALFTDPVTGYYSITLLGRASPMSSPRSPRWCRAMRREEARLG